MTLSLERRSILLFVLCTGVLAAGIGLRDPWPADEPRFALAAKEIVETGHWWFTQRGNELYSDKPPMFMWIQAVLYQTFGSMRLAFLLPSLLAALGTLALVFDLSRRLYSERVARIATAAMLITVQFTYQMKRAQIDPVLVLFTTISAYALLRYVLLRGSERWLWAGWFCAGLGIMTKGVGFLPLFLLLGVLVLRRWGFAPIPPPDGAGLRRLGLGVLFMLLPIALWLVPMALQAYLGDSPEQRAYANDLLFRQTATRLVNAWHHHKPVYYYATVIALAWLPLSLALPWLFGAWRNAWRERDARIWVPLLGAILIVFFFTLSTGKRDMYILPALPLMVWAAAPYLPDILDRLWARRVALGFALVFVLAMLAAALLAIYAEPKFELKLELERGLDAGADQIWFALLGIGVAALLAVAILWRQGPQAAVASLCVFWLGFGLILTPMLNGANSARDLMRRVAISLGPDADWGMLGWREQHLLQAQGPAPKLFGFRRNYDEQTKDALAWLHADPDRWLFADRARLKRCQSEPYPMPVYATGNRREWILLQRSALPLSCAPSTPLAPAADSVPDSVPDSAPSPALSP